MGKHSIYCPVLLREQVWAKAGQSTDNLKERYTVTCEDELWVQASLKAGDYITMSLLMRTLWQMWLDNQIVIEGFNGFITTTDLTETLLKMYVAGKVEINREDWVK